MLSFKDDDGRESVETKDYNVMIDGRNFFDQPIKNDSRPYDNIKKIARGQGEDFVLMWYKITQYNVECKFVEFTLNTLKSAIKNGTKITLNLSSNFIGRSNDETTLPHKLLLTNTQLSKISKTFANGQSGWLNFPKVSCMK